MGHPAFLSQASLGHPLRCFQGNKLKQPPHLEGTSAQTPASHGGQPAPLWEGGTWGGSSLAGSFVDQGPGVFVRVSDGARRVSPEGCPAGVLGESMAGAQLALLEGGGGTWPGAGWEGGGSGGLSLWVEKEHTSWRL